jgi:hypothetical protein
MKIQAQIKIEHNLRSYDMKRYFCIPRCIVYIQNLTIPFNIAWS